MEQQIQHALKTLREGGTILYPTDTIWGIGCDATNEKAVEKVIEIKKRKAALTDLKEHRTTLSLNTGEKSFIVLVSDEGMLNRFVKEVPEMAWNLMDVLPSDEGDEVKPLTIIYDAARGLAKNVLAIDGSIGIRMVKHSNQGGNDFCHKMIHKFGKPVVSTSANISGMPAPLDLSDIPDVIISRMDYVVKLPDPYLGRRSPSSIIRLKANGEFVIVRK